MNCPYCSEPLDENAKFCSKCGQRIPESAPAAEQESYVPDLDDVLSELDRDRKNYVLSELHGRQVIITTCDEADFSGISNATKIYVENGNYTYV